ncbi:hypothetical protein AHAS_Ahas13G0004700 [Arachis hypogaea]
MLMQIQVSMKALPWYTLLPTIEEYITEGGWTRVGAALHPLDGILQALPYSIALFIVPMHFSTHLVILFMEGIWTASIHDCINAKIWPIMGSGYHTVHHVTYRHNYGHLTIWMDWMFGTLVEPDDHKED